MSASLILGSERVNPLPSSGWFCDLFQAEASSCFTIQSLFRPRWGWARIVRAQAESGDEFCGFVAVCRRLLHSIAAGAGALPSPAQQPRLGALARTGPAVSAPGRGGGGAGPAARSRSGPAAGQGSAEPRAPCPCPGAAI